MSKKSTKMTDSEVKAKLRKWPAYAGGTRAKAKAWSSADARGWLRAQPPGDAKTRNPTSPRLVTPGASGSKTQPDGMWIWLDKYGTFCDVLAIEACGSMQNFQDKRSRYAPSVGSRLVEVKAEWSQASIQGQGKSTAKRFELAKLDEPTFSNDIFAPLRTCTTLFVLTNGDYADWSKDHIPEPHEYVCRYSSLGSYNSQAFQRFLERLMPRSRFFTNPGK